MCINLTGKRDIDKIAEDPHCLLMVDTEKPDIVEIEEDSHSLLVIETEKRVEIKEDSSNL